MDRYQAFSENTIDGKFLAHFHNNPATIQYLKGELAEFVTGLL